MDLAKIGAGTDIKVLQDQVDVLLRRVLDLERAIASITYVEPPKVREPMVRIADGTQWNPGAGAGAYLYQGGVWTKL